MKCRTPVACLSSLYDFGDRLRHREKKDYVTE